jgi:hypothetical protein
MKRCPECNEVYSEQLQYCLKDGRPLIPVGAVDDDYDTVVRPEQVVIDIEDPARPAVPVSPDIIPPQQAEPRAKVNPLAVLIAGTLIGGLLVLVAVLAFSLVNRDRSAEPSNQRPNVSLKNSSSPKPTPTDRLPSNADIAANSAREPPANSTAMNVPDPESLAKKGFNGRVIMINAVVRSSPSVDSDEIAILPFDEPVKIGKPATEHSPWFRVTTEDGTTGWMHGNTIEFIK